MSSLLRVYGWIEQELEDCHDETRKEEGRQLLLELRRQFAVNGFKPDYCDEQQSYVLIPIEA